MQYTVFSRELRPFFLLWSTQTLSSLGSAITGYALVIWSYSQQGSALTTAGLMIASYAPYVLCSLFAGAVSDRWNKRRIMLVCDAIAAFSTVVTLALLESGMLRVWHLYCLNAVSGLMNTFQQPAAEVATTALLPRGFYQKAGALRYLGSATNSILTPILATAMLGLAGMRAVIAFDFATFAVAFLTLLCAIRLPDQTDDDPAPREPFADAVKSGLRYLGDNRGILGLILFLASINFVASMYNAAFPAMMLSRAGAGERAMGIVNAVIGVATLAGAAVAAILPPPKSRVRVICNALLFSMSTENIMLAFGKTLPVWCLAGFLGWIAIPLMNTNLDAILRLSIPEVMQGRVYAARNSLQFFTIPLGYLAGGWLVDRVFEPMMAAQPLDSLLVHLFGEGKGSGAACFFAVLAVTGVAVCLAFRRIHAIWRLEEGAFISK